jgi:DNA helicase II / ATP-dependent DNA helicase PcrA
VPQRFYARTQRDGGPNHMYAARTRFIEELMLPLFAKVTWPTAIASNHTASTPHREPINIGVRLRQRWK